MLVFMISDLMCSYLVVFLILKCQGDKVRVVQTLLFVEGINTLLQTLFGTRLPTVIGGSWAFAVPIISIIHDSSLTRITDPHEVSNIENSRWFCWLTVSMMYVIYRSALSQLCRAADNNDVVCVWLTQYASISKQIHLANTLRCRYVIVAFCYRARYICTTLSKSANLLTISRLINILLEKT